MYGNSLFQPEYELIKKGFENKLQKEEILDIFQKNPRDLSEAVEKYLSSDRQRVNNSPRMFWIPLQVGEETNFVINLTV